MKINKMPITLVLLFLSWCLAISGIAIGGFLIISRFNDNVGLIKGVSVILGCLLLAAIIRMFSNIGQIVFELRVLAEKIFVSITDDMNKIKQAINQNVKDLKNQSESQTAALAEKLTILCQVTESFKQDLKNQSESQTAALAEKLAILCRVTESFKQGLENNTALVKSSYGDLKDMNQNISKIKTFFEQVEKHLDLKK